MPLDAAGYVHRIGRTGRANKTGASISLVSLMTYMVCSYKFIIRNNWHVAKFLFVLMFMSICFGNCFFRFHKRRIVLLKRLSICCKMLKRKIWTAFHLSHYLQKMLLSLYGIGLRSAIYLLRIIYLTFFWAYSIFPFLSIYATWC